MKNIDMNTAAYTSLKTAIRTAMHYSWKYSSNSDSHIDDDASWMAYNVACKVAVNGEIAEWYGMASMNGAPTFYLKTTNGTYYHVYTDWTDRFVVRKARSDAYIRFDCTNTFDRGFEATMKEEDEKAAAAEAETTETATTDTTETATTDTTETEATEEIATETETAETTDTAETTEADTTETEEPTTETQVSLLETEYQRGKLSRDVYYGLLDELVTIDEVLQRGLVTAEFAEKYRALPSGEEPTTETSATETTEDLDQPITYERFCEIVINAGCGDIAYFWGRGEFDAYQGEYGPITTRVTREIIDRFEAGDI